MTAPRDRVADILDAALAVLARDGIGGVSMRAVAREAGVSVGLANYHFTDKTSLIAAALRRIGDEDLGIVEHDTPDGHAGQRLRRALHHVADHRFLQPGYLSLRLQLWSLATVDPTYAEINRAAQRRYLDGLTDLIVDAVPGLTRAEAARRAGEILVVQNGIWLTAAIFDHAHDIDQAMARSIARCEQIALA
jgi:AcrR family transcriptional regulator